MAKLTDGFRELANEVHPAGQGAVGYRSVQARTKDVSQEGELCNDFPDQIAHPAVAELGAGAGRVDHGLDQQVADENSVRDQDHRGDLTS